MAECCGLFEIRVVDRTVIGRRGGWSFCYDTHIFVESLTPTTAMSKVIFAQAGRFLSRNPARHGIARYQVMHTASTSATSSGALFHEVWKLHWPHACIKSGAAVDPHQVSPHLSVRYREKVRKGYRPAAQTSTHTPEQHHKLDLRVIV